MAILLIIVFLFNGLNDSRQLNDLSIISAIGVDIDENGEYIITSQVLNTQKADNSSGSASGGTSVVVYETKKKSIHEALRDTIEKASKKLYIAHLELLLVSEEAAQKDILSIMDFFLRDNEGSSNFMVVIAKDDKPQEILSTLSAINPDPAKSIFQSIKSTYEFEGCTTDYLVYDTLEMVLNDKCGSVFASISLDKHEGDSQDPKSSSNQESGLECGMTSSGSDTSSSSEASTNRFKVTELAYFKDNKFIGYMDKNDAIVYNLFKNELESTVLSVGEDDNLITVEVKKSKAKLIPKFENGNYTIDIDVKIDANVTEVGKEVRENISENHEKYNEKIEDIITGKINDAIYNYKYKYEEDIVGFECIIYKKLNKQYDRENFKDKYFKNMITNVNVKVNFPLEGSDMVDGRT